MPGDPGRGDDIALLGGAGESEVERRRVHGDAPLGDRDAMGDGFLRDVDHVGGAPVASRCVSLLIRRSAASGSIAAGRPRSRRRVALATSGVPHEALADQERLDPGAAQAQAIRVLDDAAFPHHDAIRRDLRDEAFADGERHLEGAQIAIVDADQLRVEAKRALQFGLVVDLGQDIHAQFVRGIAEVGRRRDRRDRPMMRRMQSAPWKRASAT